MICLFVSSEVKSESDDLSEKKLLCQTIPKLFNGYEFVSEEEVILHNYWLGDKKVFEQTGKYTTNISEIILNFSGTEIVIDRQKLTMYSNFKSLGLCRIFEGNFESYFKNLNEKNLRELKSKQKI